MIAYYWCSLHIWHLLVSIIKQVQYWLFEDLFGSNMFQATETAFNLNSVHLKCSFYTFLPFAFSCQRFENCAIYSRKNRKEGFYDNSPMSVLSYDDH